MAGRHVIAITRGRLTAVAISWNFARCEVPRRWESDMAIGSDGLKPAMDSRHHLYPFAEAIVFLALVLDAYSRRGTVYAGLATKALKMALNDRTWQPGVLIRHSDCGVERSASCAC